MTKIANKINAALATVGGLDKFLASVEAEKRAALVATKKARLEERRAKAADKAARRDARRARKAEKKAWAMYTASLQAEVTVCAGHDNWPTKTVTVIDRLLATIDSKQEVIIPAGLLATKKALIKALARNKREYRTALRDSLFAKGNAVVFSEGWGPEVRFRDVTIENEADLVKAARYVGGDVYRVGGSVRDELLGVEPNDYDYVVIVPHAAAAARRVFAERFNVRMGNEYPVARFNFADGRQVEVSFSSGTIEDDLRRRDTTMNAIAKRVADGVVVDPFDGAADLAAGIVRHVNAASFNPLAAFRAARQVCKMEHKTGRNFKVAPETLRVMHDCKPELSPAHRVRFEWYDVVSLKAEEKFLSILRSAGISLHFEETEPDYYGNTIVPVITVV